MLKVAMRDLFSHGLRFALTTLAVVLGVGFVVGSFLVTDTLRRSIGGLFEDVTSSVDVSVRAESELGLTEGSRARIPEQLVATVAAVEGVDRAAGGTSGYAQVLDAAGEPLTTTGAPFIGVSWADDDSLNPATMDRGHPPVAADEIAIDRGSADDAQLEVGDRTSVLLLDGQREVEVVGIFTFGDTNSLLGARLTAFGEDVAQEAFGAGAEVDTVDVAAGPDVEPDELARRIEHVLPDGVEAVTSEAVADEGAEEAEGLLSVFQNVLLAFAAVALFVSAFLINNTFAIVLGQRSKELALLRALGASRAQVVGSVLAQALIVGLLASVVGVGAGIVIAQAVQALLAVAGFEVPTAGLVLTLRTWMAAGVIGVGVTALASLAPARRASSVPPIEGMLGIEVATNRSRAPRIAAGVATTVVGVLLLVAGVVGLSDTFTTALALGVGALVVFVGIALLSPLVAGPVVRVLGLPLLLFGPTGRMARANAARTPERTARTAAALMVGLAMVTTVAVVGASMKTSFARTIESAVAADLVVSNPSFTGFSPQLAADMAALREVDAVTGVRFDQVLVEGAQKPLTAADPGAVARLVDLDVQTGSVEDLDGGSILLHEDPAGDLGVEVGDGITVQMAAGGPQDLRVAGTYADSTLAGNYLVSLDLFEQGYPANDTDQLVFAGIAPEADVATARAAVDGLLEEHPQLTLEDRSEFQEGQQDQLDQVLLAVNGLLFLALFIAVIGIANTLALSVVERTREIGLLRATGMLRGQVRTMVLFESAVIALFGALLGVSLGLVFGVVAARAIPDSVISTTSIPVTTAALVVLLAATCGVLAGVLPARRAAHLEVLEAIERG
jgi:putative ABC transport system permease protein